jgi:drug/metabolite transporter (DMT)-like permease
VWLAVGLTLIGIAFTVPEVISGAGGATMIGLVFTLGNALLYAGYVLFSERLVTGSGGGDGLVASAWSLTGSLAFAFMVNVFSWPIDVPNSFKGASSMVGLGVISTVVASMAFFLGVKRLGPAPAALIASTEPVLTLIWIVLFLGESLVPIQFLGAVLVITGVIWSQRAQTEIPRIQSTKA